MKVLFLDVDGVIMTGNAMLKNISDFPDACSKIDYKFDEKAMEALRNVVMSTNTKIVLTTSWRSNPEHIGAIKTNFMYSGINPDVIIGKTPENYDLYPTRGHEVKAWIDGHGFSIERMALVDDNVEALGFFKRDAVATTYKDGLTEELANEVIKLLNTNCH